MTQSVVSALENLQSWILDLVASVWVYPALFAFALIDGIFPPIPSESVVIALAVSASTQGQPVAVLVWLIAAAGAWCGDQIAYAIGRKVGTEPVALFRRPRFRRAAEFARQTLARRGSTFILAARYVPVGRVAVNLTAGAVRYPRRRFMAISAVAAITWAGYSLLIGLLAAEWLGHQPVLAMLVGVIGGIALGVVVDRTLAWRRRRAEGRAVRASAGEPARPSGSDPS